MPKRRKNKMRKFVWLGLIAMVGLIALTVSIFESGAFHANDPDCEKCHSIHGSEEAGTTIDTGIALLRGGSGVCITCHSEEGLHGPSVYQSSIELPGGDFENSLDEDPYSSGYGHTPSGEENLVPPGNDGVPLDGKFTCNSCHDPHGNSEKSFTFRMLLRNPGGLGNSLDEGNFSSTKDDASIVWEEGVGNIEQTSSNYSVYRTPELGGDYGFGKWCSACHTQFHGGLVEKDDDEFGIEDENTGERRWRRHPTGVSLQSGEIDSEIDGAYEQTFVEPDDPDYLPLETADSAETGVTCLTCHKAHASEYSYGLRWDYIYESEDYTPGSPGGKGCTRCHIPPD